MAGIEAKRSNLTRSPAREKRLSVRITAAVEPACPVARAPHKIHGRASER
jgi:hypothetical protein